MVVFAVLAFSWIPAGLILIFGDTELHPMFRTPLPVMAFGVVSVVRLWPLLALAVVPDTET